GVNQRPALKYAARIGEAAALNRKATEEKRRTGARAVGRVHCARRIGRSTGAESCRRDCASGGVDRAKETVSRRIARLFIKIGIKCQSGSDRAWPKRPCVGPEN